MNIDKIKEVFNEGLSFTSKNKVIIIAILCIVVLVTVLLCRNDVSSVSDGFSDVNRGLADAIAGQQATTGQLRVINEGLGRATESVEVIEVGVTKVSKSLTDSSAILRRDAEIIARDSAIFEKIRSQGEKAKIRLGVEGSVNSNVHADANLRLSWQSDGYDVDVKASQSKQSISATRWF